MPVATPAKVSQRHTGPRRSTTVYTAIAELAPVMVLARVGNRGLNDPNNEPYDFFSPHGDVGNFLFADGAVHAVPRSTSVAVLQALATRSGGEVVDATGDF